uniref:EGF-like domain-containing protein n=1 Tax=Mesocestoides corti TaxID=53468 RepID=A0A5K3ESU6_MESCO
MLRQAFAFACCFMAFCAYGQEIQISNETMEISVNASEPLQNSTKQADIQCPSCYGRSVCVKPTNGSAASCYCPPDYAGELCDQAQVILPETCTKNQCFNGGICSEGKETTTCICPYNYAGTNCTRVATWIEVLVDVYNGRWLLSGTDTNTTESVKRGVACGKIISYLLTGSDPRITTSFVDCYFDGILKNDEGKKSQVALHLKFDPGVQGEDILASAVAQQIANSSELVGGPAYKTAIDDLVDISNYDVCKANKHDCSPSATCSSNGITYTCACKRFYTDGADIVRALPGRYCYYSFTSGFLLGCVVVLPLLIGTVVGTFFWRRYQAQKAWVQTSPDDAVQLVQSQYPKYTA